MHHRHRTLLQTSVEATRACYPIVRVGVLCALGFASALLVGCGELEPMREPEMVELELTTDTLKASVRDAQRMIAELRADLEVRRRELAEAQIARAQLEGRVRETERRIIESCKSSSCNGKNWPQLGRSSHMCSKGIFNYRVG